MLLNQHSFSNANPIIKIPKRIISLVPSQTELLFDLGLDEEVVGITKFSVHPVKWFKTKTRVGGTKTADIEKIKLLDPDLIIANKEENVKEQIEALQSIAPVYVSDITNLEDALIMIAEVGKLTDTSQKALKLIAAIENNFNDFSKFLLQKQLPLKTAYLIWKDPYMVAGGDTFINDMLEKCGFENIFKQSKRYPEVTIHSNQLSTNNSSVSGDNCQLIILSSEPYPFKQKHIDELKMQLPDTKIILADGEMFSWYGSRLLEAPMYFKKLIEQIPG